MAIEKREAQARASRTLARRAADNFSTVFDEGQHGMRRVRAGASLAGGVVLPVVGAAVGTDVLSRVDPNLIHSLAPLGPTAWITAASAGGLAVVASGVGGCVIGDSYSSYKRVEYRGNMRTVFAHTRTSCLWVAGAAGLAAAGLAAGDATVGAHLGAVAQVFADAAVAGGITAAIADVGRRSWSVGLPPVQRSLE